MGFSRQEYQSGLPFPSPGGLPDPEIKPGSPALRADTLLSEPLGKALVEVGGYLMEKVLGVPQRWASNLNFPYRVLSGIPCQILISFLWGFPGGPVVNNPPASAGDTSSVPGLGRPYMPQSS